MTVQNYEDFLELAKQLCPKVTLFKLSKEEVQHTTEIEKPWDNTIPIPGISNIHVAKCGLEGTVHTWKLPGEEPLNPISYSIISPSPTVAPPSNAVQSEVIEFVDRRWYVIEFDDGKFKKNYVCQLIGESGDSELVVNSYLKVNSNKNYQIGRLFKNFPVEEVVSRSQFLKMLPTPDFKAFGRVLFDTPVDFNVK